VRRQPVAVAEVACLDRAGNLLDQRQVDRALESVTIRAPTCHDSLLTKISAIDNGKYTPHRRLTDKEQP
jgi:hypothetical protein